MKRLFLSIFAMILLAPLSSNPTKSVNSLTDSIALNELLLNIARVEKVELMDIMHLVCIIKNYQSDAPKYVSSEEDSILSDALNPWIWYVDYVNYAIKKSDTNSKKFLMTYTAYIQCSEYWINYIPSRFVFLMLNESLKQDVPMNYIYAISKLETANYRYFKSIKPNENGSIDFGLMGLNSYNFDTSSEQGIRFLNAYFYSDGEFEKFDYRNQRHILKVGVAYLKDLINYTGSFRDAAIAYNGGLSRWIRGKPVKAAVQYANRVSKYAESTPGVRIGRSGYISLKAVNAVRRRDVTSTEFGTINSVESSAQNSMWYEKIHLTLSPYTKWVWVRRSNLDIRDEEDILELIKNPNKFIGTFDEGRRYVVLG